MPGRLVAPAATLDAIFQHTNRLSLLDRQRILQFLSGDTQGSSSGTSSGFIPWLSEQAMREAGSGDAADAVPSSEAGTNGNENQANSSEQYPICQVLLHEERRTERRLVQSQPATEASLRTQPPNLPTESVESPAVEHHPEDDQIPTFFFSTEDVNDQERREQQLLEEHRLRRQLQAGRYKDYTIIDQIIFEMDYQTGCWRKLRRRIRVSQSSRQNANSNDEQGDMAPRPRSLSLNNNDRSSIARPRDLEQEIARLTNVSTARRRSMLRQQEPLGRFAQSSASNINGLGIRAQETPASAARLTMNRPQQARPVVSSAPAARVPTAATSGHSTATPNGTDHTNTNGTPAGSGSAARMIQSSNTDPTPTAQSAARTSDSWEPSFNAPRPRLFGTRRPASMSVGSAPTQSTQGPTILGRPRSSAPSLHTNHPVANAASQWCGR